MHCCIWVANFLRILIKVLEYLSSKFLRLCSFLFVFFFCLSLLLLFFFLILCQVVVSRYYFPQKMSWEEFPLAFFERIYTRLFYKCLVEFSGEAIWAWIFSFGRSFSYKFNFFNGIRPFGVPVSTWLSFGGLWFSRKYFYFF